MSPIDLRSDTMTRPTQAMRAAMAIAEVGDDQFGEDPTVNRLQERAAELLGKEAALWFPTGTMANQVVLRLLTRPGDHVIVSQGSHAFWFETGGSGANAGVQLSEVGERGLFTAEDVLAAFKPRGHQFYPPTTLVEIENTHNRSGGIVFPAEEAERICRVAREHDLATYLDGARLWNAAVAASVPPARLARGADTVMVSFSKGLGCPVGSCLGFKASRRARAWEIRKRLGGGMRQSGILAAAALYALDHNLDRIGEDHANAKRFAELLSDSPAVRPSDPDTNIVMLDLRRDSDTADAVAERLARAGLRMAPWGPRRLRAVTHLDVTRADVERAARIVVETLR